MIAYDPDIIQKFSGELYRQADRIVLMSAIRFGIVGAVVGAVLSGVTGTSVFFGLLVLGGIAAFIGALMGQEKAFALRLQAQVALCQVQIERNTQEGAKA